MNLRFRRYVGLVVCSLGLVVTECSKARFPVPTGSAPASPRVHFWYGADQRFGHLGRPQRWLNILGSVEDGSAATKAWYVLDDGPRRQLTLGPDGHRLADRGDFNVEIDSRQLAAGHHDLTIQVRRADGRLQTAGMRFHWLAEDKRWPLPYRVHWKSVSNPNDVVQITDGRWQITTQGLRTRQVSYDRAFALGDAHWRDYQVRTRVIFHGFTPPHPGPPSYNVSHAAVASRWRGHSPDAHQPHRQWWPLGATSEFQLFVDLEICRWRIFDRPGAITQESTTHGIKLETPYEMIHRVETTPDGRSVYSVRLWERATPERSTWDLQRSENPAGEIESGSALLIAHNVDVTFGDIEVTSLAKPTKTDPICPSLRAGEPQGAAERLQDTPAAP